MEPGKEECQKRQTNCGITSGAAAIGGNVSPLKKFRAAPQWPALSILFTFTARRGRGGSEGCTAAGPANIFASLFKALNSNSSTCAAPVAAPRSGQGNAP
jgi:hypothetical protein